MCSFFRHSQFQQKKNRDNQNKMKKKSITLTNGHQIHWVQIEWHVIATWNGKALDWLNVSDSRIMLPLFGCHFYRICPFLTVTKS